MLQKKWTVLFVSMLLIFAWLFLSENKVQAACSIVCEWTMCGSLKNHNYRACKLCKSVCTCVPLKLKCSTACGVKKTCKADGCGGKVCCPSTAACGPVACVDSDGGSAPNVSGKVTISAPALPQVLEDSCMYLKVQTNADGSQTSQWIKQATGTHVGEKTCTNTTTGAYADTVLVCPMGCTNGACNLTSPTATPPVCRRPEGDANCDGTINGADYDILKSKLNGNAYTCTNCNADFNNDSIVDVRDYEIWRNSFLH